MKINKDKAKFVFIRWIAFLSVLLIIFGFFAFKMRKIIFIYAKSKAENILMCASNDAILKVFYENNIKYDELSHVTRDQNGNVTDIEIDTAVINILKSQIASEMYKLNRAEKYTFSIPIGTLLNNEFTSGYGPSLKFNMSLAHTASIHYKSVFTDAGINNCLHQIIIIAEIDCSVLSFGSTKSFHFTNEVIAAQSLISGKVPDSYTSVYETDPENFADDVFNYSR